MSHYDPRERTLSKAQKALQKVFPERQIMMRSGGTLRSIRLGAPSQMVMALIGVGALGWASFSTLMYVSHEQVLSAKQEEVARARSAYKTLLAQVQVYSDRISVVADNLERNHTYALSLVEQNADLDRQLQELQGELNNTRNQREVVARQKEQLVGHLRKLKAELEDAADPDGAAELTLASFESDPSGALSLHRERAARERENLRSELARLEAEMVDVAEGLLAEQQVDGIELELRRVILQRDMARTEKTDLQSQVAMLKRQLAEMENTQLALYQRFSTLAKDRIGELEGALKKTGLDVDRLLTRQNGGAQGGPFVPLEAGRWDAHTLRRSLNDLNGHVARWNSLESLAEALPLGQPMREYYISSTFGARKDPVNGRAAMHEGLDLAAPTGSPIFAGGPGKVVYAGWRGRYGRLVEIDHGYGLKTRYAHMHKIFVKKGEVVDRTTRIGLVGSSGRSTGPHLHYEVIYMGKPLNPDKFIKAGVNVFKG